jgi:hypothetical protein
MIDLYFPFFNKKGRASQKMDAWKIENGGSKKGRAERRDLFCLGALSHNLRIYSSYGSVMI